MEMLEPKLLEWGGQRYELGNPDMIQFHKPPSVHLISLPRDLSQFKTTLEPWRALLEQGALQVESYLHGQSPLEQGAPQQRRVTKAEAEREEEPAGGTPKPPDGGARGGGVEDVGFCSTGGWGWEISSGVGGGPPPLGPTMVGGDQEKRSPVLDFEVLTLT